MTAVEFIYKCRKCGKEFTNGVTSKNNGIIILIATVQGHDIPKNIFGMQPNMIELHTCSNMKSTGVADLIGINERDD